LPAPQKTSRSRAAADFADLSRYVRLVTADTYPAEMIVQCVCACGETAFRLHGDPEVGCIRRTCVACRVSAFVCDSADRWSAARPDPCTCLCGNKSFLVGVGFSFRADGDVNWVTIGVCCARCGLVGTPADWKVDYAPTDHLLQQA
jgi:hypothetical protein